MIALSNVILTVPCHVIAIDRRTKRWKVEFSPVERRGAERDGPDSILPRSIQRYANDPRLRQSLHDLDRLCFALFIIVSRMVLLPFPLVRVR